MQPKEIINPYPFEIEGGPSNLYAFTTADEVSYEIRFVPSAYMFEGYLDNYVDGYEMIIAVADNPLGKRIPADPRTAPTISTIFYHFFEAHDQRVVIFICDSADGRHEARARKFTSWYYHDVRTHYYKFDARLPDGDTSILLSIILHDYNEQFMKIIAVIQDLNRGIK